MSTPSSTNVASRMTKKIASTLARHRRAERRRRRWDWLATKAANVPGLNRLALWGLDLACRESDAAWSSLTKIARSLRRAGQARRADEVIERARGG